jgi:virulence-associated protein VapD
MGITSPAIGHNRARRRYPVYAITFDLDTEILQQAYPTSSWSNAYFDIQRFLEENGFEHMQGSVFFSNDRDINAVTCITTVQDMSEEFSWLVPSLKDIRMLRIEENNDLMPALDRKSRRRK